MVYHIARKKTWEEAKSKGEYTVDSLHEEGFIHFSKRDQVIEVANFLYKGEPDLLLLFVDEGQTKQKMVFEDLKGHGEYPHLYCPLNLDAVVRVVEFPCGQDGRFSFPDK